MLNQFNATKNRIVDYVTAKQRLSEKTQNTLNNTKLYHNYALLKAYADRRKKGGF